LEEIELMGIIDGSVTKPPETSLVQREEWIKKDGQSISFLCVALDESMLDLVCRCVMSHEIWEKLKTIHNQRAKDNIHDLHVKFYQAKFESSDTIATFFSKVKLLKS